MVKLTGSLYHCLSGNIFCITTRNLYHR